MVVFGSSACATSAKEWRRKRQAAFEEGQQKKPTTNARAKAERQGYLKQSKEREELSQLALQLGARPLPLERPCANAVCTKRALDGIFAKLDRLDTTGQGRVRILHLGDSHIAADYITRTIREYLQVRFGNAGRGFVPIGQRARYGGRLKTRKGWKRERIVDKGMAGEPFGFSGMSMVSTRADATAVYDLEPEDDDLVVYYQGHPKGPDLEVWVEAELVAEISTRASPARSKIEKAFIPVHKLGTAIPPSTMRLEARGEGLEIFGLSFESEQPGILYDSIGPVGADARVYLSLEQASFRSHLKAADPDLVVIMLGGNDGLAVRKGERSLDEVRQDHVKLIRTIKQHLPKAELLVWSPMDAGERDNDVIVSKRYIREIRDLQRETALELGCAFWDTFGSMGGAGSFGRWYEAGIMNKDMIHPRSKGGDLTGHLFAESFINAYLGSN